MRSNGGKVKVDAWLALVKLAGIVSARKLYAPKAVQNQAGEMRKFFLQLCSRLPLIPFCLMVNGIKRASRAGWAFVFYRDHLILMERYDFKRE